MFAHHADGIFAHHFTVAQYGLHQSWTHHLTSVGHTVVETDGGDGWQLCNISDAHPRQVGLCPVCGSALWVFDACFGVAGDGNLQVIGYAETMQTIDKLLWVVFVEAVNQYADPHVRGALQNARDIQKLVIASFAPVVVFHVSAMQFHHSATHIHSICHGEMTIVHGNHERHGLKYGSRFIEVADGCCALFNKITVGCLRQTRDGFDIAGGHLHENTYAGIGGTEFAHAIGECFLADVLHANVQGGLNVKPCYGRFVNLLYIAISHLFPMVASGFAAQHRVETKFQTATRFVVLGIEVADGSVGQTSVRLLAKFVFRCVETAFVSW